jgi:glyoxylase-like metal-dependent hydrolase (beta-lactamase superfamily II)
MQVGDWNVELLELTALDAPTAAFVPEDAAPEGTIRVSVNTLLLRRPGQTVIVDTGTGAMATVLEGFGTDLPGALGAQGVKPDDVDLVVITHFDGDHVGGTMEGQWPDDLQPAFPNARVVALQAEIDAAHANAQPMPFDGGPTAIGVLGDRLEGVADGTEVAPGVRLVHTPGHTPGHAMVEIDGDPPLTFVADVVHAHFLVEKIQPVNADRDQDTAIATRRRVLDGLVESGTPAFATHIPGPNPARVERAGDGYRWNQA